MPGGIHPPLRQLLTWPTPNYIDPPTQPKYVLIFACVMGPISIALVFARLWVRVRMQRNAGLDDWLVLASLVPMIALTVIYPLITERYRFNRHVWDVELDYFPTQRKFVMVIYILYSLASGLIKLSVLLFYRRLSSRAVSTTFRWIMRGTMFIIAGYTIAFVLIPIFSCSPISAFWDQVDFEKRFRPGGYKYSCINEGADVVANGIASTVQDFIVATLPAILCWNLQMSRHQKVALYSIFAISYTTVGVGAMRTYTSYRIFFQTYDVTWVSSDTWLWSLLELHIGLMCANAPALKVFFKQLSKPGKLASWINSASNRSRSTKSKQQQSSGSNTTANTDASKPSIWSKRSFWKSTSSHSSGGYLSGPHSHVSTDNRGGIIRMKAQIDTTYEERDRMSSPFKPEYTATIIGPSGRQEDIEMGELSPSTTDYDYENEIHALPQVPRPQATWLRSIRSQSAFPKY